MATLTCDGYLEFKEHAHEFLSKLPESTAEEADNGFKCLSLLYFGMTIETQLEEDMAANLLKMCGTKLLNHEAGIPIWNG